MYTGPDPSSHNSHPRRSGAARSKIRRVLPFSRHRLFGLVVTALIVLEVSSWLALWAAGHLGIHYSALNADQLSQQHVETIEGLLTSQDGYLQFDSELGWTLRPDSTSADGLYRVNAQGLRSPGTIPLAIPAGKTRVLTFGDSFTFGFGVERASTWQAILESRLPELDLVNFGVPGYGVDQAYLRYLRYQTDFPAHIVFFCFLMDNLNRNLNRFRPYLSPTASMPLAKPRFLIDGGELTLLANPLSLLSDYQTLLQTPAEVLPELGRHDYWYQHRNRAGAADVSATVRLAKMISYHFRQRFSPDGLLDSLGHFKTGTEGSEITLRLFFSEARAALRQDQLPVFLFFPEARDVQRDRDGQGRRYERLRQTLARAELPVVDMLDGFSRHAADVPVEELYRQGHFSAEANRVVATHVGDYLRASDLLNPATIVLLTAGLKASVGTHEAMSTQIP